MQLFYAPGMTGGTYTFDEEESKHCIRVLRKSAGDTVHIADGKGNLFTCVITGDHPKRCTVEVRDVTPGFGRLPYRLHLAVAPTKNADRYEWMLEKATEIGVSSFVPLVCDHSERRTVKAERFEKVVAGAMKQSLKAYLPAVGEPCPFDAFVARDFGGAQLFMGHCIEGMPRLPLRDAMEKGGEYVVLIGPEGDFSPGEVEKAHARGFRDISLGESRLRTETAGVMAAAVAAVVNM